MLYLAIIFHMHQPYYKNLVTQETELPWVRLHAIKDYLDMLKLVEKYPQVHLTFNLVPSLLEQVEDYEHGIVKDKFLELSYKPATELLQEEKEFILNNFFMINRDKVIAMHPRYYELFFKKEHHKEYSAQDYLDLQVWFNLAWFDPSFRQDMPELRAIVNKGRFFSEDDKLIVLDKQFEVIDEVIPAYKKCVAGKQVEVTVSPYYHPILPLLYSTNTARDANPKTILPSIPFAYPEDALAQIKSALDFFKARFDAPASGMWPSEESVCEQILPFIIQSGVKWIVTDEAILFKSLKKKKRDTALLYQPHLLKRREGNLNIVFRDRNLSDLIGFVYHNWRPEDAVADLLKHLENIANAFKNEDVLVTIAMDGENAWEHFTNDGHDFLNVLYQKLSAAAFLKTVTVSEYLEKFPPRHEIDTLGTGSWIYGDFAKWIGNPYKVRAWEYLALAREELKKILDAGGTVSEMAWKQMYICEGSDWFWWYGDGDDGGRFDKLFRTHLSNFYDLIDKEIPEYLKKPLDSF
jgi:alpha-amylase/alpha-mannosidase (GH57 family)